MTFGRSRAASCSPIALVALVWGCGATEPLPVCADQLSVVSRVLTNVGDTISVVAEFTPAVSATENTRCEMPPAGATLQFFSSDETVATVEPSEPVPAVDQAALVTARGDGTARVFTELTLPGEEPLGCGPPCGLLVIVELPEGGSPSGAGGGSM